MDLLQTCKGHFGDMLGVCQVNVRDKLGIFSWACQVHIRDLLGYTHEYLC